MFRKFGLMIFIIALVAILAACGQGGDEGFDLDSTSWILTSLNGDSPIAGVTFSLNFSGGRVNGTAGCNSFFGGYTQDGDTVSMPLLAMTEMYCMDPDGLMDQEGSYLQVLGQVDSFSVTGIQLRLETIDGAFLLFEAEE